MSTGELHVQETYINATEGHMIGESDVYPTGTDRRGDIYRDVQREYGRCVSKVYIDGDGGAKAVGWVFQGRDKYEDTGEPYLREVWVTVYDAPPTHTVTYSYA